MVRKGPPHWLRLLMDVRNGASSRYPFHLLAYSCVNIMATYVEYCLIVSLCVLSQLVNHGISEELLERVKKVSDEFFKNEREENFKKSTLVQSLNADQKLENVDWEDVITLLDDNEWPSKTPGFK